MEARPSDKSRLNWCHLREISYADRKGVASFLHKKSFLLQVQRKEIESHLQEAVRPHVDLAFAKLTSTQEELKRSQDLTSKLNEKFNALERQFEEQQRSLHSLLSNDHREKVNALEKEVITFKKKAIELQNRVETLEMIVKDDSKKGDSMEKNLRLLQRPSNQMQTIEQKENRCMSKDFAILPREEICSDSRCGWTKVWKIQGFREFLKRAEEEGHEIQSNSFFLGEKGYRVKLGLGVSGSYLNIHFVIMKSENDVILPWPFSNLVNYEVIDQQKNPRARMNRIEKFNPPFNDCRWEKSFLRPKLEENPRWTNQIPLSCLSERCYLFNDTVIINVLVQRR